MSSSSSLWLGLVVLSVLSACIEDHKTDEQDDRKVLATDSADATDALGEEVSPPANVTGTYLRCASSEQAVSTSVVLDCQIVGDHEHEKLDLSRLFMHPTFYYQSLPDPNIEISAQAGQASDLYHVRFVFSHPQIAMTMDQLLDFRLMFRASPIPDEQEASAERFIVAARTPFSSSFAEQLPEDFFVYYADGIVLNQPQLGFERRLLPTVNHYYTAMDGCYLACYSRSPEQAAYPVSSGIYVMGQVRVQGSYEGRLCRPKGLPLDANIAADQQFKDACNQNIDGCAGGLCWAGSDTGGWYGLP